MEIEILLNRLFPFYLKILEDGHVQEAGDSAIKLYPEIVGSNYSKYLKIIRPKFLADNIFNPELQKQLILINYFENDLTFRGQFVQMESSIYFLGSPWVTNSDRLIELGLYSYDFAIHDQLNDLLLAVKQQEIQTNDIRDLANSLEKQKVKAEEFTKSKDFFLANMSHEIRTPMNALIGFTELLSDTLLNKEQEKYVNIITKSSKNLLIIINDILDLSKIQANKLDIKKESICLNSLINQVDVFFRPTASDNGLDLIINNRVEEFTHTIIGDEIRLTQVISNLISNALKFTKKGRVELGIDILRRDSKIIELEFSVIDTGIGIPEDKIKNIFEDFYQLDIQLNKKFKGTGLGLSICKNLVGLMGGKLCVESNEGVGTAFSFSLKFNIGVTIDDDKKITKANKYDSSLRGLKVLVAEDNEFNQELIQILLRKNGLDVDIVENGKLAVEAVQENLYDLILMDVQMPVMDGVTAMEIIKKENKDLPVIALTANAISGEKENMINQGFDSYLSKPFKIRELTDLLKNAISLDKPKVELAKDEDEEFNLTRLKRLCDNDPDFMKVLIEKFISYTPLILEEFSNAQTGEDVARIAHKAKPNFIDFNIVAVVELLSSLEDPDYYENKSVRDVLISKVVGITKSVIEKLKQYKVD